jgi:hypothetical protein
MFLVPGKNAPCRPGLTVRRDASSAGADRHNLEFWTQLSASERVVEVWRLSQEQWTVAPINPDLSARRTSPLTFNSAFGVSTSEC